MDTTDRQLLALGAAAASLGLPPRELRLAAERGELPAVRVGDRAWIFDIDEVRRALIDRAAKPTEVRDVPL